MNHEIDLSKYCTRTDIILEQVGNYNNEIDLKTETIEDVKITRVSLDDNTSKLLNKKVGIYITIEFDDVTDSYNKTKLTNIFKDEFSKMLENINIKKDDSCLIIGLGNKSSTPDALGPLVVDDIIVTKHLYDMKLDVDKSYRNTSAIAPGVMGVTGIETSDIVVKLIDIVKPKFLIVIDSLASSSIDRLNKTIQMTDAGIHPGSGIGNCRKEISYEVLGVPVIAIGVPTVVDAVSIVSDTIKYLEKHISYKKSRINKKSEKLIPDNINTNFKKNDTNLNGEDKEKLFGMLGVLSDEEMRSLIYEVLTPIGYNLMVTPKEIDFVIKKISKVLANGINESIHNLNKK